MCLAIVALDAHPKYRVVIAANRDEFHARAAAPADWWANGMLAGKDLVGGGAWLALLAAAAGRWSRIFAKGFRAIRMRRRAESW
jgi:uncharacterized protein with NRDE domain